MRKDKDDIDFEVGESTDGKSWTLTITCEDGLNESDFAAACAEFGEDVLNGDISLSDPETVDRRMNRSGH